MFDGDFHLDFVGFCWCITRGTSIFFLDWLCK